MNDVTKMAGMYAIMYPKLYWNKYVIPPPRANIGKTVSPSRIYIITYAIPKRFPINAAINNITGI